MSQHENYDIAEMRKYLCTTFCSFVYKTTVQKCCFVLYLLDIRQLEGNTNFRNEFWNCTDCTKGWFYY